MDKSLLDQIATAQREAGERVVSENLQRKMGGDNDLTRNLRKKVEALEAIVKLAENALITMRDLPQREMRTSHIEAYLREKQKIT